MSSKTDSSSTKKKPQPCDDQQQQQLQISSFSQDYQQTPPFPPPAPSAEAAPPCSKKGSQAPEETEGSLSYFSNGKIAYTSTANTPIPNRAFLQLSRAGAKMDPFEVRMRFTQHLMHLNASVTSANKAAQYALKFRDMDEDLHSCIIEQLEQQNSMNTRANIMYFIEHLCDLAMRERHNAYVRMIERDIFRVVDAVAPEDGSGAANVKVVRKVLNALSEKSFITAQTVSELEVYLKERETLPDNIGLSSPAGVDVDMTDAAYTPHKSSSKANGFAPKMDKKQAEQRIEEDRERHKRLRETIWAVPNVGLGGGKNAQEVAALDTEFDRLMDETSELGEDDFDLYFEEADERKYAAVDWKEEHKARTGGAGVE